MAVAKMTILAKLHIGLDSNAFQAFVLRLRLIDKSLSRNAITAKHARITFRLWEADEEKIV